MKLRIAVAAVVTLVAVGAAGDPPVGPAPAVKPVRCDAPYRAYWLTDPADGPRPEYLRLLVTHGPVEDLAGHAAWSAHPLDNMAMTFRTYRRDSLWGDPFRGVRQVGAVDGTGKTVVIDGTTYRYEPCDLGDVVRLLERPEGELKVARRAPALAGAEQTARAFRLLLREQMKAEK
jgi:hypothetical protein